MTGTFAIWLPKCAKDAVLAHTLICVQHVHTRQGVVVHRTAHETVMLTPSSAVSAHASAINNGVRHSHTWLLGEQAVSESRRHSRTRLLGEQAVSGSSWAQDGNVPQNGSRCLPGSQNAHPVVHPCITIFICIGSTHSRAGEAG